MTTQDRYWYYIRWGRRGEFMVLAKNHRQAYLKLGIELPDEPSHGKASSKDRRTLDTLIKSMLANGQRAREAKAAP